MTAMAAVIGGYFLETGYIFLTSSCLLMKKIDSIVEKQIRMHEQSDLSFFCFSFVIKDDPCFVRDEVIE